MNREIKEELGEGFEVTLDQESYCGVRGSITRGRTAFWEVFAGTVKISADKIPGLEGQISPENRKFYIVSTDTETIQKLDQTPGKLATNAILAVCQIKARGQTSTLEFDHVRNDHFRNALPTIGLSPSE